MKTEAEVSLCEVYSNITFHVASKTEKHKTCELLVTHQPTYYDITTDWKQRKGLPLPRVTPERLLSLTKGWMRDPTPKCSPLCVFF